MKKISPSTKKPLPFLPKGSSDINCCRNPLCSNFMVPVESPDFIPQQKQKNPNTLYKRISNKYGYQLQCQECKETLPIKNKMALDNEISRLKSLSKKMVKPAGCRNDECGNNGIPITAGKEYYSKFGHNQAGNPRYKCKACNKTFAINTKPHARHKKSHLNGILFKLLVNKSPTSRILEITGLSPGSIYEKIDFIYKQCVLFSKHKEDQLPHALRGKTLNISSDAQHHLINWVTRHDKKNTRLQVFATACNDSNFVFATHLNYDPYTSQHQVEDWVRQHDLDISYPAYRNTAKYWTEDDYDKAVEHSKTKKKISKSGSSVEEDIVVTYIDTLQRNNIDESFEPDEDSSLPNRGVQIHSEYTMLAHFSLVAEMIASAKKVVHSMDQDSGIRAAFMLAYRDKLRDPNQKWIDGFYIKFLKELTVYEKQHLWEEKKDTIAKFKAENDLSERDAVYQMLQQNIQSALEFGKWKDRWVDHVQPSMAEPNRKVCHLNNRGQHSERSLPWVYMKASISGVDRFFMQSRRMVSYLERPFKSSAVQGNMWNGYNAYNPEMIMKLVEIFRVYYNYCKAGDDKKTPAQRIGLSRGKNSVEDILYYHPHANLIRVF